MIDFHVHFGIMSREQYPQRPQLGVHQLVDRMNREGIELGVLLPLESPEGGWGYLLTEEALAARDLYPERFIAFCHVDPRYPKAPALIEHFVNDCGCRGFGELVDGLAFDDPLHLAIYAKCDELGLPLVFEINKDLCWDEVGLPRLEQCLQTYRNIKWVAHGPGWWASISGDYDGQGGYPTGKVAPGGAVDRLLSEYGNLWADLSAGSGHNALTRDPDFTYGFVRRHWKKLLWGTDYLAPDQALPQVRWVKRLDLKDEFKDAITAGNARQLLGLGG